MTKVSEKGKKELLYVLVMDLSFVFLFVVYVYFTGNAVLNADGKSIRH